MELASGYGNVTVGVRRDVAAWLDLKTEHGRVRNDLDDGPPAEPASEHMAVRARVKYGDIDIRRAR